MSYEFLQILWFILIAVLWIGFHFLEGFDFGVGMLLPFLGKKDEERRAIINSIGSVWDGNEVWLQVQRQCSKSIAIQMKVTSYQDVDPR